MSGERARRPAPPHVLLVDGDERFATGIKGILELEGYVVHLHGSARTALAFARVATPDLLIVELSLPDMTGAVMIRELRAAGIDVPAMILSACAEETDKMIGFRAGADDYVTKPCSLMELLARITALLARATRADA